MRAHLVPLAAAALLAACSGSLLPKPSAALARHTLDAGPPVAVVAEAAAAAPVLVLSVPRAVAGHDSRRMVYLRQPLELQAFAFHEWVEPPAQLLAPVFVRALQGGGGFRAVVMAPSAAAGSWLLETQLIRLQQDFTTKPSQVRLSVRAVLLEGATRQVLAWRDFDVRTAASSDDPVAGVRAAQAAAEGLGRELALFCAAVRQRAQLPP